MRRDRDGFQSGFEATLFALTGESELVAAMKHLESDLTLAEYAAQVKAEITRLRTALRDGRE